MEELIFNYCFLSGPNSIAKTNIEPSGDRYIVTFIPVEVGIFDLGIKFNGKDIPGKRIAIINQLQGKIIISNTETKI